MKKEYKNWIIHNTRYKKEIQEVSKNNYTKKTNLKQNNNKRIQNVKKSTTP